MCSLRTCGLWQPHSGNRGLSGLISHIILWQNRFWWNFTLACAINLKLHNAGVGWSRIWHDNNEPGVKATVIQLLWASGRNTHLSYWVRVSTGNKMETFKLSDRLLPHNTIKCEEMDKRLRVSCLKGSIFGNKIATLPWTMNDANSGMFR
jgi:hypothetical protein